MADESVLVLSPIGVAPYSIRGATQTLDLIDDGGDFQRTVNGLLVNLAPSAFQKYRSTISCEDVEAPALDGVWLGQTLTVHCIAEIGWIMSGGPDRTAVSGSERVSGGVNYYRPVLSMMVTALSIERDEYGHMTSWRMELEEI